MRKNLLIIGLILLVIGVIVAGFSTYEVTGGAVRSISGAGNIMKAVTNGDFYSNTLNVSPDYELIVVSSVQAYLIPSQDLNSVNSANVAGFAITPSTHSASSTNTYVYIGLNGSYVVVTFGSTPPSTMDYAVLKSGGLSQLVIFGLLLIIGVLLAIVGIIVVIIGAVLKPKNRPIQQF